MLRQISLHRSLTRPILLAGGERKLVLTNYTVIAALLLGAGIHVATVLLSITLATVGHTLLVKAAHYDPMLSNIYFRFRRYQLVYLARPTVLTQHHPVCPVFKAVS